MKTSLDDLSTWTKYRNRLCRSCVANCCRLAVEVRAGDLIRLGLMEEVELEEDLKYVARRLMKSGEVEHFHSRSGVFTLSRCASGDCFFLDETTRRCTVYERRPETCRNHPQVGPRPGWCAYGKRIDQD